MEKKLQPKAALLALIIVVFALTSWEICLRARGYTPDFDDGPELWADKRGMVYEPSDKATVFVGSSRIKYDLDIATWQKSTGNHAIQLAMVGSSPLLFLDDLARDPLFKGRLVVDVTEFLFFDQSGHYDVDPAEGIKHYHKSTLAQKASFILDRPLEEHLVLLNKNHFSLSGMLNRFPVNDRPGVMPFLNFPEGFEGNNFDRQNYMTPEFLTRPDEQGQVKGIWAMLGKMSSAVPPVSGKALDTIMQRVKTDVDKIKARGGDVIFTRTPSSGPFLAGETMGYPRQKYWEKLLSGTDCKGIHFKDYPALANMQCPEFSHLSPAAATIFTRNLIDILQKEKGWKL